jgi:hypothetical protein
MGLLQLCSLSLHFSDFSSEVVTDQMPIWFYVDEHNRTKLDCKLPYLHWLSFQSKFMHISEHTYLKANLNGKENSLIFNKRSRNLQTEKLFSD